MSDEPRFKETLTTGYRSFDCECTTVNLHKLKRGEFIESTVFDVFGKKWTVTLMIKLSNCESYDLVKVMLHSCNAERVTAYYSLTVTNTKNKKEFEFKKNEEVATKFYPLIRQDIRISDLTGLEDGFCSEDQLSIKLHLAYIENAGDKPSKNEATLRIVTLDVITREHVQDWLEKGKLGLVSQDKSTHSDVDNHSFVRSFVHKDKDKRYWQCTRSKHGHGRLFVNKCLNHADLLETFEHICEEDGASLVVTLFKEEKESNQDFVPVNKNTIIIFCKLLNSCVEHSTYLGYLLVEKDTSCGDLLQKIGDDFGCFPSDPNYKAYLERDREMTDITACQGPLPEQEGGNIGYVIVVHMTRRNNEKVSLVNVKKDLVGDQTRESSNPRSDAQPPPQENSKESEEQGPSAPPQGDNKVQSSAGVKETESPSDQPPVTSHALASEGLSRFLSTITLFYSGLEDLFERAQEVWSCKLQK